MKGFKRENQLLSLCGLNCGLCPMHLGGHCPGCGGGDGNQSCKIARCGMEAGVTYCFECIKYPCSHYKGIDAYDSFITHQHQLKDMKKASTIGIAAYNREQQLKIILLQELLMKYNDGRKKTLYCLAVNLLEEEEIRLEIKRLEERIEFTSSTIKEQARLVSDRLHVLAKEHQVVLKQRKKESR